MTMPAADAVPQGGHDASARLDLACYLLRCTNNVLVVTVNGELSASTVAASLIRALADAPECAAVEIDAAAAHDTDRRNERLLLDAGTAIDEPAAADVLARRLKTRDRSLAVVVDEAHGLPAHVPRALLALGRAIGERGVRMPIALVCRDAEATRMELLAQDAGYGTDQVHRLRIAPPAVETDATRSPPWQRRAVHPAWAALLAVPVVVGLIAYQLAGGNAPPTPAPDSARAAQLPEATPASPAAEVAGGGAAAADGRWMDFTALTGLPDLTPPAVISINATPPKRMPPMLPGRLVAVSAIAGARDASPPAADAHTSPGADTASVEAPSVPNAPAADNSEGRESNEGVAPPTDDTWLAGRNSAHYTLQFIAARKQDTIDRFLGMHPELESAARVVTVDSENGTWRLVLVGDHPSRAAALGAVPAGIGADEVYVRRFSAVRH